MTDGETFNSSTWQQMKSDAADMKSQRDKHMLMPVPKKESIIVAAEKPSSRQRIETGPPSKAGPRRSTEYRATSGDLPTDEQLKSDHADLYRSFAGTGLNESSKINALRRQDNKNRRTGQN